MTVSATGEIAIDGVLGLNDVVAHAADALRGSLGDGPRDAAPAQTRMALPKPVPTSASPSAADTPPGRAAEPARAGSSPSGRSSTEQGAEEGTGQGRPEATPNALPSSTPRATPSSSADRRPEPSRP